MLTMGMTGRMLTNYVGDGRLINTGSVLPARFGPGDTQLHRQRGRNNDGLVNLSVETTNQDGAIVLSGYAEARVD